MLGHCTGRVGLDNGLLGLHLLVEHERLERTERLRNCNRDPHCDLRALGRYGSCRVLLRYGAGNFSRHDELHHVHVLLEH